MERDEVIEDLRKLSGFPDVNFSALLEFYGRNERLSALVMRDSYYSISDPKRLEITREYLTPKKIILMGNYLFLQLCYFLSQSGI